jgi:Uma2 family endonuclease
MSTVDQFSLPTNVPIVLAPVRAKAAAPEPPKPPADSLVLHGVSWDTYERLIEDLGEVYRKVTFDSGMMEIELSISRTHEIYKDFLTRLVHLLGFLGKIPLASGGECTFSRKDLQKGLEPDSCYWIENEPKMRGVRNLDIANDPLPDLVIEVDITSKSINRLEIYRVFGVPEVWRFDVPEFQILTLSSDGKYQSVEQSLSFPMLTASKVKSALAVLPTEGEDQAIRSLLADIGLAP